jgi:hypothetical protein
MTQPVLVLLFCLLNSTFAKKLNEKDNIYLYTGHDGACL